MIGLGVGAAMILVGLFLDVTREREGIARRPTDPGIDDNLPISASCQGPAT